MRLDAGADRVHHLQVDAEQVVAAHAGLPRHAGGDDDHVRAGDVGVGTRPRQLRVEALDRPGFGDVERLALRNAVDDVEEDDVAQFLHGGQMRQRPADLARPDQSNLLSRHGLRPWFWPRFAQRAMAAAIVLSGCSFKPNFWRSAEYDRVICACAPVPPSPNTFGTYPKRRISAGSRFGVLRRAAGFRPARRRFHDGRRARGGQDDGGRSVSPARWAATFRLRRTCESGSDPTA